MGLTPRKKMPAKDFQVDDKEISPFQELKDECTEVLKELEGKNIRISSNRVSEKNARKYFVEKVTPFLMQTRGSYSSCLRFENSQVDDEAQPIIKFPSESITQKTTSIVDSV